MELDKYEIDVLKRVYYPESVETLLKESIADEYILGDCIKSLIQKKLISPMIRDKKTGRFKKVFIYDGDNLSQYYFQITSRGLEETQNI